RGKRIGTPQLGNTQDVACRAWLIENGIPVTLTSGDAKVIATANPEQLPLFKQGGLDAVWTVEPWVTRLEKEAGGEIFLLQKESVTTIVVTCNRVLKKYPDLVEKFVKAHAELTDWINKNPEEAQKLVLAELEALTGGKISAELVRDSWKRLTFTSTVNKVELQKFVDYAFRCGFLKRKLDMKPIYWEKK
ncbi:MAG: ABC transporter substrate-binding protein, partial [Opitutales bacterium]|nr:ABC transporter substrate-binding protein [Opitutales bacterium]